LSPIRPLPTESQRLRPASVATSTPEQSEQDDDRDGDTEKPQQDGTTHDDLLEVEISAIDSAPAAGRAAFRGGEAGGEGAEEHGRIGGLPKQRAVASQVPRLSQRLP
jgi:hypothetical protein